MLEVRINPLARDDVARIFPLIQLSDQTLTLPDWCDYTEPLLEGSAPEARGMLLARLDCGTVVGYLEHEVQLLESGCRNMSVVRLCIFGYFACHRLEIAVAMIQALEEAARTAGCMSLTSTTADDFSHWERRNFDLLLLMAGHERAGHCYHKRL